MMAFQTYKDIFGINSNKININSFAPYIGNLINNLSPQTKINISSEHKWPHASTDGGKFVNIPTSWFDYNFWQGFINKLNLQYEVRDVSITATLAVILHETFHTIYTNNCNKYEVLKNYVAEKEINDCGTIFNILEDYYIDNKAGLIRDARMFYPSLVDMRSITNAILDDELVGLIDSDNNLNKFIQLYSLLLNPVGTNNQLIVDFLNSGDYGYDIFEKVKTENRFKLRVQYSVELYELLKQYMSEEEKQKQEDGDGGEEGDGGFSNIPDSLKELLGELIEAMGESSGNGNGQANSFKDLLESSSAKETETLSSKDIVFTKPKVPCLAGKGSVDGWHLIEPRIGGSVFSNWKVDEKYGKLAHAFQNFTSLKTKGERPGFYGRINPVNAFKAFYSNNKASIPIYNEPMTRQAKDFPEVIVLADGSGSMLYTHGKDGKTLYQLACEGVTGITREFYKINVPFAALVHTTSGNDTVLYTIGGKDMPLNILKGDRSITTIKNVEERAKLAIQVDNSANADGVALELANMFFTGNRKKLLIVLSDGSPSNSGKGNMSPIDHTKEVIRQLRNKGTVVMSLSLIKEVMATNNMIYGKENNIDATDLEKAMVTVFNSIAYHNQIH